jgi:hypothetical protein
MPEHVAQFIRWLSVRIAVWHQMVRHKHKHNIRYRFFQSEVLLHSIIDAGRIETRGLLFKGQNVIGKLDA